VEQLLNDKALARQMGEHGRQLVAEQYEFSKYINALESLFARAVEEPALAAIA
jgi:glycosyltransferase involved in cell wall biosynthesis